MARLIKQSEFYDAFTPDNSKRRDMYYNYETKTDKGYNDFYEVFINPTDKEINDTFDKDPQRDIRGVIYDNGDLIIWPGSIKHISINNYVNNPIDLNQMRFAVRKGGTSLFCDLHGKYSLEEFYYFVVKHKDIFNRFTNIDMVPIEVYDASDIDDTDNRVTLNEMAKMLGIAV